MVLDNLHDLVHVVFTVPFHGNGGWFWDRFFIHGGVVICVWKGMVREGRVGVIMVLKASAYDWRIGFGTGAEVV